MIFKQLVIKFLVMAMKIMIVMVLTFRTCIFVVMLYDLVVGCRSTSTVRMRG